MYLSGDLTLLFDTIGIPFEDNLLNSTDQISDYVTTNKKAMNLGVYTADLSYTKVFNQYEVSEKYFRAMEKLAVELGIPGDYFENAAKRFDRNIANRDSLIKIANEVFMTTDQYLKANEREAASSLIIYGGWIEAMYIATAISNSYSNHLLFERISEQKSSLNNLMQLLENDNKENELTPYLKHLDVLKKEFKKFNFDYKTDYTSGSVQAIKVLDEYRSWVIEMHQVLKKIRQEVVASAAV